MYIKWNWLSPDRLLWKLQCNIFAKNRPEVHHIGYLQSAFTITIYGYTHFQFTLVCALYYFHEIYENNPW